MKKNIRIYANYKSDLALIVQWLKLNRAISHAGTPYETKRGGYSVGVKPRAGKEEVQRIVKDRFGSFAKVF